MCGLTLPTVEIKGRLKKQIYKHWLFIAGFVKMGISLQLHADLEL